MADAPTAAGTLSAGPPSVAAEAAMGVGGGASEELAPGGGANGAATRTASVSAPSSMSSAMASSSSPSSSPKMLSAYSSATNGVIWLSSRPVPWLSSAKA